MKRFTRGLGQARWILAVLVTLGGLAAANPATAGVISSGDGAFSVGITSTGNLFDSGVGFRRNADNYDPILPGTPREAWGVSAGGVSGYSDPTDFGVSNVLPNGPALFSPSSAMISTFLNNGASNLLKIDQNYSFAENNVLAIKTTITNVSASAQTVMFSRNVDWDISPTMFNEIIHAPGRPGSVAGSSYYGFENPDPTVSFGSDPGPGGGTFGPGDLGAAFGLNLGPLAAGASTSFTVLEAINRSGQSATDLAGELTGHGAVYVLTGYSSDEGHTNSAALGFSPDAVAAVPEPATVTLLACAGLTLLGYGWRRRRLAL
jgi:hypothetical protein